MKIDLLPSVLDRDLLGNITIVASRNKNGVISDFILDTGCEKTIIPWELALRLNIPIKSLNRYKTPVNLGGNKYNAYEYNHSIFSFVSNNGKEAKESFPSLILRPTSKKKWEEEGGLPVIIGLDFLKERKYILFCDLDNDVAYIEKK